MKPVEQKSPYDGRNEVTAPGTEQVYRSPQTFLTPDTGQGRPEGFFCSSILPQFLAHRQPLLGIRNGPLNLQSLFEDIVSHFSMTVFS